MTGCICLLCSITQLVACHDTVVISFACISNSAFSAFNTCHRGNNWRRSESTASCNISNNGKVPQHRAWNFLVCPLTTDCVSLDAIMMFWVALESKSARLHDNKPPCGNFYVLNNVCWKHQTLCTNQHFHTKNGNYEKRFHLLWKTHGKFRNSESLNVYNHAAIISIIPTDGWQQSSE